MGTLLVDANVLVRLRDKASPFHDPCMALYRAVAARRTDVRICAQTLIEFWVVATRPVAANGMGLTPAEADVDVSDFLTVFELMPEPAGIARTWHELVVRFAVSGKPAHDARLVAFMQCHGIAEIVTLNGGTSRVTRS